MTSKFCVWKLYSDGYSDYYETSCGQAFQLNNDQGLKGNGFKFCCYCSRSLKEKRR